MEKLVFAEERKLRILAKNPEINEKPSPLMTSTQDSKQVILVGGECYHHCTIPVPLLAILHVMSDLSVKLNHTLAVRLKW